MSRKYITKLYNEDMARFAASKSGSMCTMGVDGWSSEDIILVVGISLDNQLVDLVDTQTDRHTADNLATVVETVVPRVEQEFSCTVVAIVTDSATNMALMRTKVATTLKVETYACQAHPLNLCVHDVLRMRGEQGYAHTRLAHPAKLLHFQVLTSVTTVLKAFRSVCGVPG